MKAKTDAAKILLEAGWTTQEINRVLESTSFTLGTIMGDTTVMCYQDIQAKPPSIDFPYKIK